MSNEPKIYLYTRWQGKFKVLEGHVEYSRYYRGHARFIYQNGRKEKYVQCGLEAGIVSNRVVWLTERNDELARKIFIEYERDRISELEYKIVCHRQNIEDLVNGR